MTETSDAGKSPKHGNFPTTHWSMVLEAGGARETQAQSALERLCRLYWFPLYTYVRQTGRSHHEAEDCTQAFLAHLLEVHGFQRPKRDRGRFRTFLLSSLRHFMISQWLKEHALKRGGGTHVLSLDWKDADHRFVNDPADPGLTPEEAFDRVCARELIQHALADLRGDYEKRGSAQLFHALAPILMSDPGSEPLSPIASKLSMNTHAVATALQRMRSRLGRRLRALVTETVATPAEVDAELHHLLASLRARE